MTSSLNVVLNPMNTGVTCLFVLGFLLHVAAVLCMFDIYFRSPLVHGMPNFHPTTPAPSRRLVFIVGTSALRDSLVDLTVLIS